MSGLGCCRCTLNPKPILQVNMGACLRIGNVRVILGSCGDNGKRKWKLQGLGFRGLGFHWGYTGVILQEF